MAFIDLLMTQIYTVGNKTARVLLGETWDPFHHFSQWIQAGKAMNLWQMADPADSGQPYLNVANPEHDQEVQYHHLWPHVPLLYCILPPLVSL